MSKIVLLDNIRSMQNVGAIFRNADGAWFEKLILTWYTPFPPRNDIAKTALGWEKCIDWEYFQDSSNIISQLKDEWYVIWAVELCADSIDYSELFNISEEKVCLIMWNEVSGVSEWILSSVDKKIVIPMRGTKESLNVSVAAGIVMYAVQ